VEQAYFSDALIARAACEIRQRTLKATPTIAPPANTADPGIRLARALIVSQENRAGICGGVRVEKGGEIWNPFGRQSNERS
jgi:hypothetical protein